jgi:EAL domain-containing protein (putative c-di-GMP-specific phosphodiesterase class I)
MAPDDLAAGCSGECADPAKFTIRMAFQPVVDLDSKRIYAYEALVRGDHGESAFLVFSEISEADRYAFDQACRVKAICTAAKLGLDRRLNINFKPSAVYHPESCLKLTLATAREVNFPSELITFEFTEDEPIDRRGHLKGIIEHYRKRGFQTALDDFGSGYAGLSVLAHFQPDVIKIDRALVDHIDGSRAGQAIVAGLLKTTELLGMSVVAEGVERREEIDVLRAMGITCFQGFYFARPAIERLIPDDEIPWL